jgi:hypothetical protein
MEAGVFLNALWIGLAMSAVLTVIVLASLYYNPLIGLKDYPPEVLRKGRKRQPKDTQQHRYYFGIPFLLVTVGSVILALTRIPQATGGEFTFIYAFLTAATVLLFFNLVDLLVIDGLLGMVVRPKFMVVPGTEGMPAYRNTTFYLKSFLRSSLMILLYSVAFAAFAMAIYTVVR